MSDSAQHAGPAAPLTAASAGWRAFTSWRRRRPFWAGVLLIAAGAELLMIPLPMHSMGLILHIGTGGVLGILIGTILIVCALLLWFNPPQRIFYSIVAVLLAIAALVATNLGGFLIGTLLGVIGGSLGFAWTPGPPAAAAGGRRRWPPQRAGQPADGGPEPDAAGHTDHDGNAGTVLRGLATLPVVLAGLAGLPHPAHDAIALTAAITVQAPAAAAGPSLCLPGLPPLPIINQCPSPSPSPSPSGSPDPSQPDCPSPGPGISIPLISGSTSSGSKGSGSTGSGNTASGSTPSGNTAARNTAAGSTASPSPSPSPSCSPSPTPGISLPLPGTSPSPAPSPSADRSPGASPSPSPSPRTGAAPVISVAAVPSQLTASSAAITGFAYDGLVSVRTRYGHEKMLQFTMTSLQLTNMTLTARQGGATSTSTASSLGLSGSVVLYATKLSGDLAGVPITVTPSTPLATILYLLAPLSRKLPITMTNVVTSQPYSSGSAMQVSGLKIS